MDLAPAGQARAPGADLGLSASLLCRHPLLCAGSSYRQRQAYRPEDGRCGPRGQPDAYRDSRSQIVRGVVMTQQSLGHKRLVVGAHYGTLDFIAQRVTGVIMAIYTVVLLLGFLFMG